MNADELELVARLGEAEPLSEEALAAAEASLRAVVAASSPSGPARARRRPRRTLAVTAAAATVAAALTAGSLALTGGGPARPTSTHAGRETHGVTTTHPAGVQRFELAGFSLELPAGYHPVDQDCPALTLPPDVNVAVQSPYPAASSPSGGCIEGVLASGPLATPPAGGQQVQVGSYQGYLVTSSDSLELYVA